MLLILYPGLLLITIVYTTYITTYKIYNINYTYYYIDLYKPSRHSLLMIGRQVLNRKSLPRKKIFNLY